MVVTSLRSRLIMALQAARSALYPCRNATNTDRCLDPAPATYSTSSGLISVVELERIAATVHPCRAAAKHRRDRMSANRSISGEFWLVQPLSTIGGIQGSATMRRCSAQSGFTPFFITVAR
jgi:hypothetical protein